MTVSMSVSAPDMANADGMLTVSCPNRTRVDRASASVAHLVGGLGVRNWGWGFEVWGLGFGVWGLGFGVRGLRLGVWGLG